MARQELGILISGILDRAKTESDINKQLERISQKINKLKIPVEIDPDMLKKINDFTKSIQKVSQVVDDQNKVVSQTQEVFKKLDGTVETVTRNFLKSGEIIQKTKIVHDENAKAIKNEADATQNLTDKLDQFGKLQRTVLSQDGSGNLKSKTLQLSKDYTKTSLTLNPQDEVTARKITIDHNKEYRDQQKIIEGIVNTTRKRAEEERKLAENQAKYVNKNKELQWDLEQAEQRRVKNLGFMKMDKIDDSAFIGDYNTIKGNMDSYIKSIYGVDAELVKLSRTFDKNNNEIWKFQANLKTGKDTFNQFNGSIDKTTKAIYDNGQVTQKTLSRNLTMWEQFRIAASRIPIWINLPISPLYQ